MKKVAIGLLVLLGLIVVLVAAVTTAVWFFPKSVVNVAARAARSHGIELAVTDLRGSPASGWTIDGLNVSGAAFKVSARKVRLDVNWSSTVGGRPALDLLWVDGLRADILPSTAPATAAKSDGPPKLLPVADLRFTDGKVTIEKTDGDPFVVDGIGLTASLKADRAEVSRLRATVMDNTLDARGSYAPAERTGDVEARVLGCLAAPGLPPGRCIDDLSLAAKVKGDDVNLSSVSALVEGSTVTGRGQFHLKPMSARLTLASKGPLSIQADIRGDESRWSFNAVGNHQTSRFAANAAIDLKSDVWTASMTAVGIPADLVPGLPRSLGALSATLKADGHGKSPATLTGGGRLDAAATNGPHVTADLSMSNGDARAAVAVSSGGVNGNVKAAWQLARREGDVIGDLKLDAKGLGRWLAFSANGPVRFEVKGPQASLAWSVDADLRNVASPAATIEKLSIKGSGPSLAPPEGRVSVDVTGVDKGGQKIEKASLTVDGRLTRHTFELALSREGAKLAAAGTGALVNGAWSSTWTKLDADLGQAWRLASPFRLNAGAKGSAIHDFHLVSDASGSFRLDGTVTGARMDAVTVSMQGLQLEGLTKLAGLTTPVAGTASIEATASGPFSRPTVKATGHVAGLSIDKRPAGDLDAAVRTENGRVIVDHLDLVSKGGTLSASADLPMSFSGRTAPPFTLRLRTTGLDPAALPIPLGDWKFDKAILKGDLTVAGKGGGFSATGKLEFDANRIGTDEKKGPELKDVHLRLVGDGASLRFEQATAKGGDGTVTISGSVASTRADLAFSAHDFEFRYPAGVYLKFNSDLKLTGPWAAPRVDGRVDISKGEFKPVKEKKDKDKKKEEKPVETKPAEAGSSPLSAEVAVKFDSNVWYRDGQTAIELKGDIQVRKDAGGPALAFGTVETLRGNYYFYGRAFSIDSGRVTFTGDTPPDPQLAVSASYLNEANKVKIIINTTGTLNNPRIALSSEPPMEETDIIAVLVTGAPLGAERQNNGNEALARSMAANYLAEKVREQVQNKIPIDVLQFKLQEGGGADLTIGDRVTKDLYLSYGQTLGTDAERRVNAEYVLTPRFSLNGQTSNLGRYVLDLLFKFGFY